MHDRRLGRRLTPFVPIAVIVVLTFADVLFTR